MRPCTRAESLAGLASASLSARGEEGGDEEAGWRRRGQGGKGQEGERDRWTSGDGRVETELDEHVRTFRVWRGEEREEVVFKMLKRGREGRGGRVCRGVHGG